MKRRITVLAMTLFFTMAAIPVVAGGTKEDTSDEQIVQNQKNVLHGVGERPADFGEGGGGGAARVPEGFEEEDLLKTGEVKAELTVLTGKLKVSGGKGKRSFKLKTDDGTWLVDDIRLIEKVEPEIVRPLPTPAPLSEDALS